ncbi:MAG: endonuclease/exonuclease/phosphatase family protein [Candidatus Omnitrophica bacterium]|nr:endonuclease/exonuclease/phosphatase family protein [Candidatus Omnitrophota bacterium]
MNASGLKPYPIRRVILFAACVIPFLWLPGQILKDRFLPLNFLYYIPPLLCFFSGCVAFFTMGRAWKWLRWTVLLIAILALAKSLVLDFEYHSRGEPTTESIRFVQWNVSAGRFGTELLVDRLRSNRPDLILLSEAPPDMESLKISRALFRNGYWFRSDGMALLSRFPIEVLERLDLPDGRGWAATVKTGARSFDLVAIDLRANLFVSRQPDLEFLSDWVVNRETDRPLIVAGDFNTPRDSVHFQGLRKNLQHAYETSGHGWPYSWPFPVPLIQTDHMWCSEGIEPIDHRYDFTLGSDHLPQVFDFKISSKETF